MNIHNKDAILLSSENTSDANSFKMTQAILKFTNNVFYQIIDQCEYLI